jgi:acetyltransferase-like isoleucine patch superfamily enzyme
MAVGGIRTYPECEPTPLDTPTMSMRDKGVCIKSARGWLWESVMRSGREQSLFAVGLGLHRAGRISRRIRFAEDLHRRWESHPSLPWPERVRRARSVLTDRTRAAIYLRHAKMGEGIRVSGRLLVANHGELTVGDDCTFRAPVAPIDIYVGPHAEISIGQGVRFHSGDTISALMRVEIGDRVQIGPHVTIHDNAFHDLHDRNKIPDSKPVIVEDDVWLASKCTVLPGVRIGRGAVVGAHALVTGDVEPFTVVGGVPAQPITRLDQEKFVPSSDWAASRE